MSEPDVVRKIKADFVPAATGMETLATTGDPAAIQWFATMAVRAVAKAGYLKRWEKNPTWQGIYVAGADGTAYRIVDDWQPAGFLRALDAALTEFRKQPPGDVALGDEEIRKADPPGPGPSTSVIRLYYRCSPTPPGAHPVNRSIGRDHLWIYPGEVREIVRDMALPPRVAARIVRYHMIDHVRGLGDGWAHEEVRRSEFSLRLVDEVEGRRTYALTGDFACEKDYPGDINYRGKLGVEGKLEGEFQVEGDRIVRFRARVDATAWDANTNTWHQPKGRFPPVIGMVETDDDLSKVLQPVWRAYPMDYDRPR